MAALSAAPPPRGRGVITLSSPNSSSPSFVDMVKGVQAAADFTVSAKIGAVDGIPSVTFENLDLAKAASAFRLTLVMKFCSGQRPSIDNIRAEIRSHWGMKTSVTASLLNSRHVLLGFSVEEDMVRALAKESSRILGALYKIFRWTPEFDPNHDAAIAPVWVQLRDLPPHLYLPPMLKNIAKSIGHYLKSDHATETMTNTTRARFCVEIDLMKKLPEKMYISVSKTKKILQKVTYEEIPYFCTNCILQGHELAQCRKVSSSKNTLANLGLTKETHTEKQGSEPRDAHQVLDKNSEPTEDIITQEAQQVSVEIPELAAKSNEGVQLTFQPQDLSVDVQQRSPYSNKFGVLEFLDEDVVEGSTPQTNVQIVVNENGSDKQEDTQSVDTLEKGEIREQVESTTLVLNGDEDVLVNTHVHSPIQEQDDSEEVRVVPDTPEVSSFLDVIEEGELSNMEEGEVSNVEEGLPNKERDLVIIPPTKLS